MRVIVCGGRDYADGKRVYKFLDDFDRKTPITLLAHGDARGADTLASRWATSRGVAQQPFPANWRDYGPKAGSMRNQLMADVMKPDVVIAFPGGRGTADMVKRGYLADAKVIKVDWE